MRGQALFTPSSTTEKHLFYAEHGTHEGPFGVLDFFKNYIYEIKSPHSFSLYFAAHEQKGEHFMTFDGPLGSALTAEHMCEKDIYQGTFQRLGDRDFVMSYNVRGPKKDYSIITHCTRMHPHR